MGVMAYEMATGVPPFQHPESMPLMLMHVHTAPVPPRARNPALPEAFEEAILRCLEKDPARRFPSCRDLGRRLEEIRVAAAARA
jgi:serine/threonine protein kinase